MVLWCCVPSRVLCPEALLYLRWPGSVCHPIPTPPPQSGNGRAATLTWVNLATATDAAGTAGVATTCARRDSSLPVGLSYASFSTADSASFLTLPAPVTFSWCVVARYLSASTNAGRFITDVTNGPNVVLGHYGGQARALGGAGAKVGGYAAVGSERGEGRAILLSLVCLARRVSSALLAWQRC